MDVRKERRTRGATVCQKHDHNTNSTQRTALLNRRSIIPSHGPSHTINCTFMYVLEFEQPQFKCTPVRNVLARVLVLQHNLTPKLQQLEYSEYSLRHNSLSTMVGAWLDVTRKKPSRDVTPETSSQRPIHPSIHRGPTAGRITKRTKNHVKQCSNNGNNSPFSTGRLDKYQFHNNGNELNMAHCAHSMHYNGNAWLGTNQPNNTVQNKYKKYIRNYPITTVK